jgi:hypothetical protein
MIKKVPFKKYSIKEKEIKDILNIRLNEQERNELNHFKKVLNQPKDSTTLKTLAEIGKIVLQEKKQVLIINTLFKNKLNNQRTGIQEIE